MKSIRTKLLLLILFLTFIPLVTTSFIFLRDATQALRKDAHILYEHDLENVNAHIDSILEERIKKIKSLKESSSLASFVLLGMKKYEFDSDVYMMQKAEGLKFEPALPDIGDLVNFGILLGHSGNQKISDFGIFPSVEYVNADGMVKLHIYAGGSNDNDFTEENLTKLNRSRERWFTEALEKGLFISTPQMVKLYLKKYNPNPTISEVEEEVISKKLTIIAMRYEPQGKVQGVLMATTSPDSLYNEIDKLPEEGYIYAIDGNGDVIVRNKKAMQKNLLGEGLTKIILREDNGWRYHQGNLVLYRRSKISDRRIALFMPERYILGLVYRLSAKTTFMMVLTLVFVTAAVVFFTRIITKPIKDLTKGVKTIGKGDLAYRVKIETQDELGELAYSFNKMTEDLQKTTVSRDELAKEVQERKRVEEQLRESELYSRTILDAVKAGFILIDADSHKIVEVNAVAINMFGMSKENIIGSVCHQFICPAEVGKCPITDLGQTVDNSERILLNAKGGRVPVIKTVAPVIFGSRKYLLESFIDITERKSMEEELRKRMQDLEEVKAKLEERTKDLSHAQEATLNMMEDLEEAKVYIENILVNFLDSLMVVSIDGTIQKVNQVTLNLLGYKQEELLGQRAGIIADEGVLLNMVLEKGELRDYEINYRRKDGRLIPMLFSGSIMRDKDGGLIGLVEAAKDITERKKAEEILQNYTKEIEGINKELDDFTYIISHDLKEPLRSIDAFSKFIEDDYRERLDEEGRGYLKRIRANSLRMQNLIEDLLEFSRIERKRNPLEEVQAQDLIEEVKLRLEYAIKEKNVEIVIQDNLPKIFCDRVRLVEVFVNLVSNAIKFNDKPNPKIEVGCNAKDNHYEFFVKDNGPGIEEQYFQKIFEIFQRLGKREDVEGTGAGLTIVRKIIEMHKGKIWVESKVGEYTVFYFTIPKRKQAILGKKKLGEILVEKNLVTEEELKKALDEQKG